MLLIAISVISAISVIGIWATVRYLRCWCYNSYNSYNSYFLQCAVKLVQESYVVLEVEAQVLHTVLQHSDTLNTHTKGEA